MYAKFCVNREAANNFMRLFVNRRAYAIQAERPLPNGSVPYYPARDWKTKEPKPLDESVVRMHPVSYTHLNRPLSRERLGPSSA